jgi:hypothetical protein
MRAVKIDNMDGKVIKQGAPDIQSRCGASGKHHEVEIHLVVFEMNHRDKWPRGWNLNSAKS